ncbi:MAG: helix-turn-helix domain-containing protein [Azoarcus sp.]|jgi:hypothetical protein|nr:helix-turn-helix domain-containing protein [Azoarcus sp.]
MNFFTYIHTIHNPVIDLAPPAAPGLPDAEKLKIKTGLVVEIGKAMRALELKQFNPPHRFAPLMG